MPGITSAIVGARNLGQLEENPGPMDWEFPPGEWQELGTVSASPVDYPQDFHSWVEPLTHQDLGTP
jgi:aryl-alcohol dehydrogenase-like predicted oxidoreductase